MCVVLLLEEEHYIRIPVGSTPSSKRIFPLTGRNTPTLENSILAEIEFNLGRVLASKMVKIVGESLDRKFNFSISISGLSGALGSQISVVARC